MRTQSYNPAAISMLCRAIFALYCFPMAIHGFANNLVGSTTGCMTELDTSEVIMNSVVKAAEESDFPKMHLVVIEDDNNMESPFHYTPSEEQFTIAFVNPYSKDEFREDIQFVMDVEGPAEFVGGGAIGCEGNKRVAARLFNGGQVQLKLLDPTASLRIWAGWATGHEAVRLTPNLLLEPKPNATPKTPDTKSEKMAGHRKQRELKGPRDAHEHVKGERNLPASPTTPEIVELDKANKAAKSGKKSHDKNFKEKGKGSNEKKREKMEKLKELKKEADDKRKKLHSRWTPKIGDKVPLKDPKESVGATKIVKNTKLAVEEKEADIDDDDDAPVEKAKLMDEKERRKELQEQMLRNFPEKGIHGLLARYESDSFGGGLHMSGYYYGCAFFIFSFGTLLSLLSRRKEKGRRDL